MTLVFYTWPCRLYLSPEGVVNCFERNSFSQQPGKDDMCKCGCRGWCTWFPILLTLAWDLIALAHGEKMPYDYVGNYVEALAEKYMFVCCILDIRGDWPAWCEVAGLRTWAHGTFPCPKCNISKSLMIKCDPLPINSNDLIWDQYTHEQYKKELADRVIATGICLKSRLVGPSFLFPF